MKLFRILRLCCILVLLAVGALLAQVPARIQKPPRPTNKLSLPEPPQALQWAPGKILRFDSVAQASGTILPDGSVLVSGANPATDTYMVTVETDMPEVSALRIEAMVDPSLGGTGPGRTPHGNFVISEVTASVGPREGGAARVFQFTKAEADFSQAGLPADNAIDGNRATGWAILGDASAKWNVNRTLTLTLDKPAAFPNGSRWTIGIVQQFGSNHTLGRFRIHFGGKTGFLFAQGIQVVPGFLQPLTLSTGNWDFESGLQGWTVGAESGDNRAFAAQPTYGDNVFADRLRVANTRTMGFDPAIYTRIGGDYWDTPVYTGYQGDWWVGSSENRPNKNSAAGGRGSEDHRGNMISPDFKMDKLVASCLISGGTDLNNLRVELQVKSNDQADKNTLLSQLRASTLPLEDGPYVVVSRITGPGSEVMVRTPMDVPALARGRICRYKVIDKSLSSHINVDDFRVGDSVQASPAPVWGFVDTHTHPMVHMAFGGGWNVPFSQRNSLIWGSPGGRLEDVHLVNDELPDCDGFTHGNATGLGTSIIDHVMRFIGNFAGNLARHGTGGASNAFSTWPAAGGMAGLLHQQMHVQWLRRAYDGGQRILVAAAINNQLLMRALKNGYDVTGNKITTPVADGDYATCVQQTLAMKDFVAKNSTWMEVVTTPAQARNAIRNNKMAVILAVETDWLNGMDQVRTLYNLGVRHITPVHLMDNIFGSSAVYDWKFNSLNAWYNGRIFEVVDGTGKGVNYRPDLNIPIVNFAFNVPTVPGLASGGDLFAGGYTVSPAWPPSAHKYGGYINKYGLSNYTKALGGAAKANPTECYKEMMKMGMLIDVAHMSQKSVDELLSLVEGVTAGSDRGYPVSSSHGGIREQEDTANERSLSIEQCKRILRNGGTLALGIGPAHVKTAPNSTVPNDCPTTSKSFSQLVQHGNNLFDAQTQAGGLTLGSDFNGMNGMMGPRFGSKAPAGAPPQTDGVRYLNFSTTGVTSKAIQRPLRPSIMTFQIQGTTGIKSWDYNTEGAAHAGLTPDMFQDARNTGLRADQTARLFRGAEDFIRMWEKCERMKSAVVASTTAPAPIPAASPASTTMKMTGFNPAVHGFRFTNDFRNSFMGPPINWTTNGLCGGMSYTVLDYYLAGMTPTRQDYRPANSTALQQFLYGRQVTSLVQNMDKWLEYGLNPLGSRNQEFFNWGLRERLVELRSFIDRGMPVPLGLKSTGGLNDGDHQVLAIGYDMNGYGGDPAGPNKERLKIFLCEPNYPGKTITMMADPAKAEFYYEGESKRWRSYFVDGKYAKMTPPVHTVPTYPNDGLAHELLLEIGTADDDLRGGADFLNLEVTIQGSPNQTFANISQGGRWLPNYNETARVILHTPVNPNSIRLLKFTMSPSFGINRDVWEVRKVWTKVVVGNGLPGGLVKPLHEHNFQTFQLNIGRFVGTPFKLFGSPEMFMMIGIPPK